MPFLTQPNFTRRRFLQTGAVAFASMYTLNSAAAESAHWAFLSDTHIPLDPNETYRGFKPFYNLKKVVPMLQEAKPQGINISGDLARLKGLEGDYETLYYLLQPIIESTPICLGLGNHDDRVNFYKTFDTTPGEPQPVRDKHIVALDLGPVRLLSLDSLMYVNKVAGLLGRSQRQWLAKYLDESDETPTLLVVHHTLRDGDGDLLDVERMFDIIAPHKKVKAIIYGHSHVYQYDIRDGIHLINLPAVGYNFREQDPVGWVEANLSAQGAELTLHAIDGNTRDDGKVTQVQWRS